MHILQEDVKLFCNKPYFIFGVLLQIFSRNCICRYIEKKFTFFWLNPKSWAFWKSEDRSEVIGTAETWPPISPDNLSGLLPPLETAGRLHASRNRDPRTARIRCWVLRQYTLVAIGKGSTTTAKRQRNTWSRRVLWIQLRKQKPSVQFGNQGTGQNSKFSPKSNKAPLVIAE